MKAISTIDDLIDRVHTYGFLPMFRCPVRNFSVYENCSPFWREDEDGPWEWKGPVIREGNCAYGKFFNRKAGFVSLEWLPHFINYRRSLMLAPDEDKAALDDIILQIIETERFITIKELREAMGLSPKRRKACDPVESEVKVGKLNLDTFITRLMMEGKVTIADFIYNIDKRGNPYGWGIAKYTTPEILYGASIRANCPPDDSLTLMVNHLKKILPHAKEKDILKFIS